MCEALMEIVRDKIKDELKDARESGMESGIECGVEKGMELIKASRTDEIERVVTDREYQKKLLKEFGI